MILPNGTLLQGGKYRIEKKIGQGGFGITYRACQPLMLDRKVCIKEFYLKQCFSRESTSSAITYPNDSARKDAEVFQQKFIKEAQTLYSMHHPNIMEIYDIFEENNTAYYVMEYIEGESLKDMLERRGSIPEAEAIGYIRKVAEALKYIHSRNFNHFDVKPDNILVRSSDKEVILIDFGTAKHYDSNTGNATTMTAGLLSRGYAPIEQYKEGGVNSFTPETDIYALGATLYKLLTGNTPPEPTEIISNGIPELPSSVSQSTKDLIKWAMQLNKADRPHSCDEFMKALPVNSDLDFEKDASKGDNTADEATTISSLETENISEETKFINKDDASLDEETRIYGVDNVQQSTNNLKKDSNISIFDEADYIIDNKYMSDPYRTSLEAENGNVDAALAYGFMCLRGTAVTKDLNNAYAAFCFAKDKGDARAASIILQWESILEKYSGEIIDDRKNHTVQINDSEVWTVGDLEKDILEGGKFVYFTYAISIIILSWKCNSKVYYIKSNEKAIIKGWKYLLLSFLLGWWGAPFGFIYTIQSIGTAFSGEEVTEEVMNSIE